MSFYQRLEQLGISSHLDDYVFGTHFVSVLGA